MRPQDYINTILTELAVPLRSEKIADDKLEETIFAKVMSKKFRKLKATDDTIAIVKQAIHHSVSNNKPIMFNLIFGGNKLWHFEESPEIDWSELFTTIYMMHWMKTIASVYGPGAYFEFYSEDLVLEIMNNLPPKETDQYSETFKAMLIWVQQFLPKGVSVGYKRYLEEYKDRNEYLIELEEAKANVLKELGGQLPELSDKQKAAIDLNVRLRPGQTDDPQWREKVELIHKSIERTKTMEKYIDDTTMIPVCPTYFPGCLTTGSTKKSYAKFWVGVGALEKSDKGFNELVLTPKQLEQVEFDWEKMNISGLPGKNFNQIRMLKKPL